MGFHNTLFPVDIGYGSASGPGYRTDIVEVDSGAEERVGRWTNPKHKFDVAYGVKSPEQLSTLKRFFLARKGSAYGFRYKDWMDFATTSTGQLAATGQAVTMLDVQLGVGDGTTDEFQLRKFYSDGDIVRTRVITKPVSETVLIAVNGELVDSADYSVNDTSGVVTFNDPPEADAVITWGGEFHVPARFAAGTDEWLRMSYDAFTVQSASGIELVEVLESTEGSEEAYMGGASRRAPMTANYQLSYSDDRVQVCDPNDDDRQLRLPDPDNGAEGSPHFVVINISATKQLDVAKMDGTVIVSIAPSGPFGGSGRQFCVAVDEDGDRQWVYL